MQTNNDPLPIFILIRFRLHEVSELLNKKQNFLEKKVDDELDIIKKNGTKNKRVSMAALKRKKRYEEQLAKIDGKLLEESL